MAIKIYYVVALLMVMATATLASIPLQKNETSLITPRLHQNITSLRGPMTCHRYPRVCREVGSPGPDCCWGKCVNVDTDRQNCGRCGKCCRYGQACCGGCCVDVLFDPMNCGCCGNKCMPGASCKYGMCNY